MREWILILCCASAGCAVGKDYVRPETGVKDALWTDMTATSTAIGVTSAEPWRAWWTIFHDDELEQLVAEAIRGNQDLRVAIARVATARQVAREAFAPLLPTLDAQGDYAYQKQSKQILPYATGKAYSTFSLAASAGYELDFWGHLRRGLEAAQADEIAIQQDRRTVEISVIADTTTAYFDLGAADAALAIAREALSLRQGTLDLVRVRYESGIGRELDLRRAQGELAAAQADLFEATRVRDVSAHRLALLLGRMPETQFTTTAPRAFRVPPQIPIGLPSELLERRPDVAAAEARLKAANARAGMAYADFFPRFTIAGRFGYASLDAKNLFQSDAQLFSFGPSIYLPIFHGSAIEARWKAMLSRTDEASATYRGVILRAFSEVAGALSGIAWHDKARDGLEREVKVATRAVELADADYRQGLTTYLEVIDAQRTLLTAEQALVRARRNLLADIVGLERALGGGWREDRATPSTADRSRASSSAPGASSG